MQAILVVLLTVLGAALADQPVINTPPSVVQCLPSQVTFSGGTGPYYISAIPGGQPGATPLQDFGLVTTSPLIWIVPQAAGTAITLQIRDSEGQLNYSQQVTVQPGKTDCSASSTNTSSSSTATTSPTSTTPVATNTTASNTTSGSNNSTSLNTTTTTTPAKTNTSAPATTTPVKGTSPFTTPTTNPTSVSTATSTPAAGAASAASTSFERSTSLIAIVAIGVAMALYA